MYQIDPTQMPNTLLPTMYDLKSEDPEEPGLPDMFHWLQPYYAVFDHYTYNYRLFQLEDGRYREARLLNNRFWIPEIQLGLGVWEGSYQGTVQHWLRWYDVAGNWILNHQECLESARERAESARLEKERWIAKLTALNLDHDAL